MASKSSAVPQVLTRLVQLQQELAAAQNVVMDGRDIGTVVLPHAQVKIYLTASVEVRARRRFLELQEKGEPAVFETIAADIAERDHRDMTREVSPLKQADDAVLVDTSDMTIDEVTERILRIVEEKTGLLKGDSNV
jgi:cytidylate kinase